MNDSDSGNKPSLIPNITKTKNNSKPITPKISDLALKQQNVTTNEMPPPPTILPVPPPSNNVSKLTPTPNEVPLTQPAPSVSQPQEKQF